MIRGSWLSPLLALAWIALVIPSAGAQSVPLAPLDETEVGTSRIELHPEIPAEPDPAAAPAPETGIPLLASPHGGAPVPLILALHASAPVGAPADPFAVGMALAGSSVPAAGAPSLTYAATTAVAMQPQTGDPYWGLESQRWGGAGGVSWYDFQDSEFRLGAEREEWDSVDRFEFSMYSREPLHGHVEAMIGGFIFYEERDWSEGASKILYDTWGFGVDMGAMIYPMERADERKFNIGFLPYFRLAMGFGDGDFRDIEVDLPLGTGTASGDMDDLRFDIGVGVEARAVIARQFFAGVGVGYNWWTTADGAAGTTSSGGVVIIVEDEFDFGGDEAYIRFSAGFFF